MSMPRRCQKETWENKWYVMKIKTSQGCCCAGICRTQKYKKGSIQLIVQPFECVRSSDASWSLIFLSQPLDAEILKLLVDEEKQSGIGCANNCFNDDQVLAPKDRSILYNVWLICLKTHSFIKAGFFFAAVLYMPTLLCFPSTTQINSKYPVP